MRAIRPAALLGALLLPAVLIAAPTQGEPSGSAPDARADSPWTRINTGTGSNITIPSLLRTPDGVLHVVYEQEAGSVSNYEHTTVSTTGAVLGHTNAVSSWGTLANDPQLIPTATGGMRVIFGGLQDINVANPFSAGHLYTAVSDASGASWAVPSEAWSRSGSGYASYGTFASLLPDGNTLAGLDPQRRHSVPRRTARPAGRPGGSGRPGLHRAGLLPLLHDQRRDGRRRVGRVVLQRRGRRHLRQADLPDPGREHQGSALLHER